MTPIRIFISSVQSEFEQERAALRNHIHEDPWIRQFFNERWPGASPQGQRLRLASSLIP